MREPIYRSMEDAKKILSRYRKGACTAEELELLLHWFDEAGADVTRQFSEEEIRALQQAFRDKFRLQQRRSLPRRRRAWIAASAAAVLLLVGISLIFFPSSDTAFWFASSSDVEDIVPGGHKAILTLGDGKQIVLDNEDTGPVASDGTLLVKQVEAGLLVYDFADDISESDQVVYNTIQTPPGGTYRVMLPDGTIVWLNNLTTLRYPVHVRDQPRIVELLEGEAFFQVSHQQTDGLAQSFSVRTGDEVVEVLGTEFNISAYPGEPRRTTLIKGSIQIGQLGSATKFAMHPGQQAVFSNGVPEIRNIDSEAVYAWKEGYFLFDDETLENIMKKVARWYDVEIQYAADVDRQGKFWGSVSKFENVKILLEKLELTGAVRFEIKGRRVSVMR